MPRDATAQASALAGVERRAGAHGAGHYCPGVAVAAIVLALVIVAVAVVAERFRRRAAAEAAARRAGDERIEGLERELASASAGSAAATVRAEQAERRAEAEAEAVRAAEHRARASADALAVAEAAARVDVDDLWAMELARTERTWRISVASDPLGPSPFTTAEDPLRAAVEVEAAAWREESGTFVELDWDVPADLPVATRLVALRRVQEELAAVVKSLEHAVVRGRADGDVVAVTIAPGGDPPLANP